MAVDIPFVAGNPHHSFITVIDGTEYVFTARWNARDAAWFFDILDIDDNPIRYGIKVVLGAILGGRIADARFPSGYFMAEDLSGQNLEAGLDALGDRVVVSFFTVDDFDTVVQPDTGVLF